MMSQWKFRKSSALLEVGVLTVTVFGVPDKEPRSFTWQFGMKHHGFVAGSEPTLSEACATGEKVLRNAVKAINYGDNILDS
jgi:hypothetical protein